MKITVENRQYDINLEKAKDLGLVKEIITHKLGNFYKIIYDKFERRMGMEKDALNDLYILCKIHERNYYDRCMMALIGINLANQWNNAVEVNDMFNISENEWIIICGGKEFQQINVEIREKS